MMSLIVLSRASHFLKACLIKEYKHSKASCIVAIPRRYVLSWPARAYRGLWPVIFS